MKPGLWIHLVTDEIINVIGRHPNKYFGRDAWVIELADYADEHCAGTYMYIPRSAYGEFFYVGEL